MACGATPLVARGHHDHGAAVADMGTKKRINGNG
jgi:hypothetical protein